ncbi:hypothetical protein [Kineococcus sp. SYSU DK004]|uniref:hypothetical protein n=1 Tax=Kineococcus sp. SYSU DK004 TaxID=3383125 RepID=UPI003D7D8EC1
MRGAVAVAVAAGVQTGGWLLLEALGRVQWTQGWVGLLLAWLGLLAVVVVLADRWVQPLAGLVTTAVGTGLLVLALIVLVAVSEERWWLEPLVVLALGYVALSCVLALGVTGAVAGWRRVPARRRGWAAAVAAVASSAGWGWLAWLPGGEAGVGGDVVGGDVVPAWVYAGALATLLAATVIAEVKVRSWTGPALAVVPAAVAAFAPLVAQDAALGVMGWLILTVTAAGACLLAAAAVAGVKRMSRRAPRGRQAVART